MKITELVQNETYSLNEVVFVSLYKNKTKTMLDVGAIVIFLIAESNLFKFKTLIQRPGDKKPKWYFFFIELIELDKLEKIT